MKLGILILQYNSVHFTEQLCKKIPEAIVIDNGSTKNFNVSNEVIRLGNNFGFTKGWIKGIEAVYDRFDAFWLMNNDIDIDRKSIDRVKELVADGIDMFTPSYNGWAKEFHNQNTGGLRDVGCIEFTAPIISKKVFESIGMFDENYSLGYGVEFDFCYRARKAGFKVYVDDLSNFYHYGQQTTGIELEKTIVEHESIANKESREVSIKKYGTEWEKLLFKGIKLTSDINKPVLLYTTIFGDYTNLKPLPKQNVNFKAICVTDNPYLKAEGWEIKLVDKPEKNLHPRMRAKYWKLFPWEIDNSEISIFIDGSILVQSNNFISHCITSLTGDMTLYRHPSGRKKISDEVLCAAKLKKYIGCPMDEQVKSYYSNGYNDELGLFACGVMIRRHTPKVKKVMTDWWEENIKWTYQDQLSFPYVCWKNNFIPDVFIESQENNYFKIIWHDDDKKPAIDVIKWDFIKVGEKIITSPKYDRVKTNYGITPETIDRFQLKIKTSNYNIKIWQLYYNGNKDCKEDSLFIQRENKNPDRATNPYQENTDILDIFFNEDWQTSDFIGIVSRRFFNKTGLTFNDIADKIDPNCFIYSLTPKKYNNKVHIYCNGKVKGIDQICSYIDSWKILPVKLTGYNGFMSSCNFWLMSPDNFKEYVVKWLLPVMDILQNSKKSKFIFDFETSHLNQEKYKSVVFFLEGLFSVFIATKHYKTIQ